MTPDGPSFVPGARRPRLIDLRPKVEDLRGAVLRGLDASPKAIPSRFLYNAEGSRLFERITTLPEYYPTRAEIEILERRAGEIAARVGPGVQLVELGSGSSAKVGRLLDALESVSAYVPIDISAEPLMAAAQRLQAAYPALRIEAVCADYAQPFDLPPADGGRRLGFYPGSTIGNLTPDEARAFLRLWAGRLGPSALMLVGVDLRKPAAVLERAYDDSQGVTAAFSLNLLARINRELEADFDLSAFRHEAEYDADSGRVAIHLRALGDQTVAVAGRRFHFHAGERLHVEDSWKYSLEEFAALARDAGYRPLTAWTDEAGLFSVHLLAVEDA